MKENTSRVLYLLISLGETGQTLPSGGIISAYQYNITVSFWSKVECENFNLRGWLTFLAVLMREDKLLCFRYFIREKNIY